MSRILKRFSGGIDERDMQDGLVEQGNEFGEGEPDVPATTLGADIEFKGTLTFKNKLCINGTFEGTLFSDTGYLSIGKDAVIKSDIRVGDVLVQGSIQGNVVAKGCVAIKSSARIQGDIKASRLSVEEGVIFQGHVDIGPHIKKQDTKDTNKAADDK